MEHLMEHLQASGALIWIDLEMTGLDPNQDYILEIATMVTDPELNIIAQGPELAIYQDPAHLAQMDAWNKKHHGESGLIQRVLDSRINELDAQAQTLDFLRSYVKPKTSPMCGNTICQDRRFLAQYMPALEAFFHYRHIDVSTVKELARRWAPDLYKQHKKKSSHVALDDIKESIEELRYYREHFFSYKS